MNKLTAALRALLPSKKAKAGPGLHAHPVAVATEPGITGQQEPILQAPLAGEPGTANAAGEPVPANPLFTFAPSTEAGSLQLAVEVEELQIVENPLFLQVGSVSGCTYKDALAYARSLADGMFPSPEHVKYRIVEDKLRDRFVYELHEGGPGLSIAEQIIGALSAGESVHIELANGYQASIEEAHGEIFTLRYPPVSEQLVPGSGDVEGYVDRSRVVPITAFTGAKKLQALVSDRSVLRPVGLGLLAFSTVVLLLGGGLWVALKSQVLDNDFVLSQAKLGVIARVQDNPVLHLDRARNDADAANKSIHKLQKQPGKGWSHELK